MEIFGKLTQFIFLLIFIILLIFYFIIKYAEKRAFLQSSVPVPVIIKWLDIFSVIFLSLNILLVIFLIIKG